MRRKVVLLFLFLLAFAGNAQTPAQSIRFLAHGEDSLAARLLAIKSAKSSVDLATYVFDPCHSAGQLLLGALVKKADQGLKIRLVIDDYEWHEYTKAGMTDFLAKHHIQFRVFNDQSKIPHTPTPRLHAKILLIDGSSSQPTYFVGGRNSSSGYFGLSPHLNYIDQDLEISGRSGRAVKTAFDRLWTSAEKPVSHITGYGFEGSCLQPKERTQKLAAFFAQNEESIVQALTPVQCTNLSFRLDETGSHSSVTKKLTTDLVLKFIAGAQEHLNAANQYYLPPDQERRVFDDLRDKRHVPTLIFTNLTADPGGLIMKKMTSDMVAAMKRDARESLRIAPFSSFGNLRDEGRFSIAGTPWRIHTKSMVRDHEDVLIGSYNFDQLSYSANVESALEVDDCPALAQQVELDYKKLWDIFQDDKKSCANCYGQSLELNPVLDLLITPAEAYF